jgi:hypothetical protein
MLRQWADCHIAEDSYVTNVCAQISSTPQFMVSGFSKEVHGYSRKYSIFKL